jgi:hypothetical protein
VWARVLFVVLLPDQVQLFRVPGWVCVLDDHDCGDLLCHTVRVFFFRRLFLVLLDGETERYDLFYLVARPWLRSLQLFR